VTADAQLGESPADLVPVYAYRLAVRTNKATMIEHSQRRRVNQ